MSAKLIIKNIIYKKLDFLNLNYFKNKIIMKNIKTNIKKAISLASLSIFIFNSIVPITATATAQLATSNSKIVYPLKEVSKLSCRFTPFNELWAECKQDLPILNTADYEKYAKQNWWYNEFTRFYTVLWWSSYKYGWDVWNGWHMWMDIATAQWTPVYSIAEWTVIVAKRLGMEWNTVSVSHNINWKNIVSNYMHLHKIDVKAWDKVRVWQKIWEVGSTWNSTGNHLHMQIDLETRSSPAYYNYNTCPYSYYKITEEGVCFEELQRITVDPLLFLETGWAVLNEIRTTTKIDLTDRNTNNSSNNSSTNSTSSIFDRTVHIWYAIADVMEVQQIYKDLWYYNWPINWDFNDVLESVIDYQVDKWVIAARNSTWAGWFGPATRAQTKKDYNNFLAWWSTPTQNNNDKYESVEENNIPTQKISRNNLMTREEIEAIEVQNFLKDYNISLRFQNTSSNVAIWTTEVLKLSITDRRGRPFIWNMPGGMTFTVNTDMVEMFPTKLFHFTDWKRDINVKWLREWITKLYIQIWNVTVRTFDINIYNWNKTIYPESARIASHNWIVLGETKTAIWIFNDSNNKPFLNMPFGSTFKLVASEWNEVCIKSWDFRNINKIYNTKCSDKDYKKEITFDYSDTVWWLLIFDYKVTNRTANFQIINTYNNVTMSNRRVTVNEPKWLANSYEYRSEVLRMLENWVATWINNWFFMEDRALTQADAFTWIRNSLKKLENETVDSATKLKIANNIKDIESRQANASRFTNLTRVEFSALVYRYLVFDTRNIEVTRNFRDLDESTNKIANAVFWTKTWKDQFGNNYFQPNNTITRWESSYLLSVMLENHGSRFLTLK